MGAHRSPLHVEAIGYSAPGTPAADEGFIGRALGTPSGTGLTHTAATHRC